MAIGHFMSYYMYVTFVNKVGQSDPELFLINTLQHLSLVHKLKNKEEHTFSKQQETAVV